MPEVLAGVHRWEAPHPEWTPEDAEAGQGWEQVVASHLVETDDGPVLIDPLISDRGWETVESALAGRTPHVLITIFWHTRSAPAVLRRYPDAVVWTHAPAADLVRERGAAARTFAPGDPLPGGIEAIDAHRAYEVLFYLPARSALVVGDVFLGDAVNGLRLCPPGWLGKRDPEEVRAALRSELLELPIEHVLLAHGAPVLGIGREALERALHSPPNAS